MAKGEAKTNLSREDDYRDYDQRDIADGWPYDDGAGATAKPVENRSYGETDSNFDRERNAGFRVNQVDSEGFEPQPATPILPTTDQREEDDQLEADIMEALTLEDEVTLAAIDVHVDGHRVTLRGSVDTAEDRRRIELKTLGVAGVSQVVNHITTIGIDSHIPRDTD